MTIPNQFRLLREKKFYPLFITQFLGAFHDNLYKNALVVLIIYHLAAELGYSQKTQQLLTTLAAGALILPFFLFSAIGGQLADRFPKEKVMQGVKIFEICIALMGSVSLVLGWLPLCYLTIFALGMHSALFAPSKYSILPQHLAQKELIGGNALLSTGTFLAILLGTIVGTMTMTAEIGVYIVSGLMFVTAVTGYLASLSIPHAPPEDQNQKVSFNFFTETARVIRYAFRQPKNIIWPMLGKAWFFFIGSMFMAQFANFTKGYLGGDEHILTLFLILFSIGIAVGGLCNNRLLKGRISGAFTPFAAIGLTVFSLDIYYTSLAIHPPSFDTLVGLYEFLGQLTSWRIIVDIFMVAFFGGLYVVPLSTIIQDRTPARTRARIMAGSSIFDSLFMVVSAILSVFLISIGWTVPDLFLAFGIANAFVACYMWITIRHYLPPSE